MPGYLRCTGVFAASAYGFFPRPDFQLFRVFAFIQGRNGNGARRHLILSLLRRPGWGGRFCATKPLHLELQRSFFALLLKYSSKPATKGPMIGSGALSDSEVKDFIPSNSGIDTLRPDRSI